MLIRPDDLLFLSPDSDTGDGSDTGTAEPPAGQDWEARFKGLQREFNKLKTQYDSQTNLSQNYLGQLESIKNEAKGLTSQYEGQLNETRTQLNTFKAQAEALEKEKADLAQNVTKLQRDQSVRKELSKPEYQNLAAWYDSGYLQVEGKEGEELTTYLDGFKTLLGQKSAADFQKTMSSATPPQFTPASQPTGGMTQAELSKWLNSNVGHADYDRFQEQYYTLVSQG